MKLKKWLTVLAVAGSVCVLTACSSGRKPHDDVAINDANSTYNLNDDAESSGLGGDNDSSFGEKVIDGHKVIARRVYYFDFDSSSVRPDDRTQVVANAAKVAGSNKVKVMLEGHTDPRGSREYNIGLGERRAKSVADIMTTKGVSPSQVSIVSYGAEKPAAPGRSESDYQQDRRVVLVYLQQ